MKIICEQSSMIRALNIVSNAVPVRSTMPAMTGILMKAYPDGRLKITATDNTMTIQDTIAVNVEIPGEILIPAKLVEDIIRKLPGSELTIATDENDNVEITSLNAHFELPAMDSSEFPEVRPVSDETEAIQINRSMLRDMINRTSFSASVDEARGIITGVLMEMAEGHINLVAIDGYRMAITRHATPDVGNHSFVISAKLLNDIAKIISDASDDEENGMIYLDDKKAVFGFGNIMAQLRLLNGTFVDYQGILPRDTSIEVKANRKELAAAIERASLMNRSNKNSLVKMNFIGNVLTITSGSEEGNVQEEMVVEKSGDDISIGFNSHYLMDVLKAVPDDEIRILLNSAIDPVLVEPVEGDEYEYLVLPVRI